MDNRFSIIATIVTTIIVIIYEFIINEVLKWVWKLWSSLQ